MGGKPKKRATLTDEQHMDREFNRRMTMSAAIIENDDESLPDNDGGEVLTREEYERRRQEDGTAAREARILAMTGPELDAYLYGPR